MTAIARPDEAIVLKTVDYAWMVGWMDRVHPDLLGGYASLHHPPRWPNGERPAGPDPLP